MKKLVVVILFTAFISSAFAQEFIPLWPEGDMPNSKGLTLEYREKKQLISQVDQPGIYSFFTSDRDNSGSAVLICPPGGYSVLAYNIAGFQFAKWLNSIGVNAFVLIHRLPNSPDLIDSEKGPIQDAQRAMKIIRSNASTWELDANRMGIMGASAGGHLASTIGTHAEDFSRIGDSLDSVSFHPNFMILISPVISFVEDAHQGSAKHFLGGEPSPDKLKLYSNELQVTKSTPPSFLVHAQNDPSVSVKNSMMFYQAMVDHGVTGSLHIFPKGKHSIGLRNKDTIVNAWTDLCETWLRDVGML
jgi:acetyl esterase/lipase